MKPQFDHRLSNLRRLVNGAGRRPRVLTFSLLAAFGAAALVGCKQSAGERCEVTSDCEAGLVCPTGGGQCKSTLAEATGGATGTGSGGNSSGGNGGNGGNAGNGVASTGGAGGSTATGGGAGAGGGGGSLAANGGAAGQAGAGGNSGAGGKAGAAGSMAAGGLGGI